MGPPRHRAQQILGAAPQRTCLHRLIEVLIQGPDLGGEHGDERLQRGTHAPVAGLAQAVLLRRAHGDEIAPSGNERLQRLTRFIRQGARLGAHGLREGGNRPGIKPVGLGQLPGGAGVIPHLARVDHRHRQPCGGQFSGRPQLQPAGGLQHHQSGGEGREALEKGAQASFIISNLENLTGGQGAVQALFGDIDADIHAHEPILADAGLQSPGDCAGE